MSKKILDDTLKVRDVTQTAKINSLVKELKQTDPSARISVENTVFITKTNEGKVVWLETGTESAGLQHILKRHTGEFLDAGFSQAEISDVVMTAIKQNKVIGKTTAGVPVYKVTYKGISDRIQIVISDNGFIIQSNPYHKKILPLK